MRLNIIVLFVLLCCSCHSNDTQKNNEANTTEIIQDSPIVSPKPAPIVENKIFIEFDSIKPRLNIQQTQSSDDMKIWLISAISKVSEDDKSIFTKQLGSFLNEIPDDITMDMDPGAEKQFKKKWHSIYDLNYIGFMHPFYDGNGGCSKFKISSINFIGSYKNANYYKTKISCVDYGESFDRTFKVIKKNGIFKIDAIINKN